MYRRSIEDMPALTHELEEAVEEGVELMLMVSPARFEREADGRLTGVVARHMSKGEPDASGRPRPVEIEGSDFFVESDTVITAVSQVPDLKGFHAVDGSGKWLSADKDGKITERILGGGDVLGLGIAGTAIVQGRHAAEQLHARLRGEPGSVDEDESSPVSAEDVLLDTRESHPANRPLRRSSADRLLRPGTEVYETLSEEQFLKEAERCMSCGACAGCEQCYMYCTSGCFVRVDEAEPGQYFSLNLDECRQCGKCVEVCPTGYLETL